jgi:hypothetical protein
MRRYKQDGLTAQPPPFSPPHTSLQLTRLAGGKMELVLPAELP